MVAQSERLEKKDIKLTQKLYCYQTRETQEKQRGPSSLHLMLGAAHGCSCLGLFDTQILLWKHGGVNASGSTCSEIFLNKKLILPFHKISHWALLHNFPAYRSPLLARSPSLLCFGSRGRRLQWGRTVNQRQSITQAGAPSGISGTVVSHCPRWRYCLPFWVPKSMEQHLTMAASAPGAAFSYF